MACRWPPGRCTACSGLHRADEFDAIVAQTRKVAELTQAMGARHLVFVPVPGYRDDTTGAYLEPAELDEDAWRTLIRSTNELGKIVAGEYGVRLQFHPHADSHVETQAQTERFLDETDPDAVSLCLDTGHLAYRRADSVAIIRNYPDRIGYVHIKQMDPAIVERAEREDLAFGQAVAMGASCEPPAGLPDIPLGGRRRCRSWTPRSSSSSSRTCTPSSSTSPARSPGAPTRTCAASASVPSARTRDGAPTMTVRVGVIGVGMIGRDHIRRLTRVLAGARVTAVSDVDADVRRRGGSVAEWLRTSAAATSRSPCMRRART